MRPLIFALLLYSCAQPATPYTHTPGVMDTGTPPHRLRVGHYITGDGLPLPVPDVYFDTVLGVECSPSLDFDAQMRCFPRVGYQPRAYRDSGCTEEIALGESNGLEGHLAGAYDYPLTTWLRVSRVGQEISMDTYWDTDGGFCVQHAMAQHQFAYALGEDITATLETLDLQWRDTP